MEFDIVFEGGGAKGMVFVGASTALEERGHTARRLVGTSPREPRALTVVGSRPSGMA